MASVATSLKTSTPTVVTTSAHCESMPSSNVSSPASTTARSKDTFMVTPVSECAANATDKRIVDSLAVAAIVAPPPPKGGLTPRAQSVIRMQDELTGEREVVQKMAAAYESGDHSFYHSLARVSPLLIEKVERDYAQEPDALLLLLKDQTFQSIVGHSPTEAMVALKHFSAALIEVTGRNSRAHVQFLTDALDLTDALTKKGSVDQGFFYETIVCERLPGCARLLSDLHANTVMASNGDASAEAELQKHAEVAKLAEVAATMPELVAHVLSTELRRAIKDARSLAALARLARQLGDDVTALCSPQLSRAFAESYVEIMGTVDSNRRVVLVLTAFGASWVPPEHAADLAHMLPQSAQRQVRSTPQRWASPTY